MFNNIPEMARTKSHWYRFGDRLAIKSAAALLVDKRFRFYIDQLRELSGLPNEHFQAFYHAFVERFAEFVQVIPETPNSQLGSFLTNGLRRGLNTLDYFVKHFDKPSPLERFALFTACVLQNISKIITAQKIYITDEGGAFVKLWQPFCGPLTEQYEGESFKIMPIAQIYDRINKPILVALARQVIGENGFLWIASDLHLFTEWVEALVEDDEEGSRRLVKVIRRYRRSGGGLIDSLPIGEIEILDSMETEYADKFYEWLIDGLNKGNIKVNTSDSHVHITDSGVFIETPGIFKDFARLHNVPVNHFVIFTQFGNLIGIARKGGHDYQYMQLFSDYPEGANAVSKTSLSSPFSHKAHKVRDGILISDIHSVYTKKGSPNTSPHIKLPSGLKTSGQALAHYNFVTHPNNSLKNK